MNEPSDTGSCFADRAAAERALAMALPLIEPLMRDASVVGSGFLHIVIMDPARGPHECSFDDAVLLEHSLGDRARWDADYAAFARAKARLSWHHGQGTHALQAMSPHLLRSGDTMLAGSAWLDGIVVGVSGAHPHYDEAFATCVAACLRAGAKQRWHEALERRELFAGG
jgi:hypothetical protein